MLGSPGETLETAFATLELNQKLKPDFPRATLTQPYPNSPLMKYCEENDLLEDDFHVDKMESSYYFSNPIKFENKREIIRLQQLFGICVRWPFLTPVVRKLIHMKRGDLLFSLIFRANYVYTAYMFINYDIFNFLRIGLKVRKTYFTPKTEKKILAP